MADLYLLRTNLYSSLNVTFFMMSLISAKSTTVKFWRHSTRLCTQPGKVASKFHRDIRVDMYSRNLSHWYRVSSILKNVNNMDCDPLLWWLLLSQFKYDGKFILNSVDYILDVPCTKYCSDPFIRIRVRANRNFHRIWRDLNYIGVIVSEKEPLGYFSQSCKCFRVILFNTRQTHLSCHLGPPCNRQQDCSYITPGSPVGRKVCLAGIGLQSKFRGRKAVVCWTTGLMQI